MERPGLLPASSCLLEVGDRPNHGRGRGGWQAVLPSQMGGHVRARREFARVCRHRPRRVPFPTFTLKYVHTPRNAFGLCTGREREQISTRCPWLYTDNTSNDRRDVSSNHWSCWCTGKSRCPILRGCLWKSTAHAKTLSQWFSTCLTSSPRVLRRFPSEQERSEDDRNRRPVQWPRLRFRSHN